MHGKHSLTASVVALGPFGTRTTPAYHRESFSIVGGNQFARSMRQTGPQAAMVLIHVEMPDAAELLRLAETADGPIVLRATAELDSDAPASKWTVRILDSEGKRVIGRRSFKKRDSAEHWASENPPKAGTHYQLFYGCDSFGYIASGQEVSR